MNPPPTDWHQAIVLNIGRVLGNEQLRLGARWVPIAGMSTCVAAPQRSLPQPDVQVLERGLGPKPLPTTDDAIAVFEIISPSNRRPSQLWRQRAFATVPNLQHYVTISQVRVEVIVHDRDRNWKARPFRSLRSTLALPALGDVTIPLAEIYRFTGLGKG